MINDTIENDQDGDDISLPSKFSEPWLLGSANRVVLAENTGFPVFGYDTGTLNIYEYEPEDEEFAKRNVKRAIACVNSLEGIDDPEKFVKQIRTLVKQVAVLIETIQKIQSIQVFSAQTAISEVSDFNIETLNYVFGILEKHDQRALESIADSHNDHN